MLSDRVAVSARRIGLNKIESPILYNCPVGIRFEISESLGEPYRKGKANDAYVSPALKRAMVLYQNAACTFDTLLWTICYPQGSVEIEEKLLKRFCDLTKLPLPQERYLETTAPDNEQEEPEVKVWYYWDIDRYTANIKGLFEEIIKADLGGFAALASSVFLIDTNLNVLFYLYDDRGLDVAAELRDTIAPLYSSFGKWILEYDRKRIDSIFAD